MSTYWLRTDRGALIRADTIVSWHPDGSGENYKVEVCTSSTRGDSGHLGWGIGPASFVFAKGTSQKWANQLVFDALRRLDIPTEHTAVLIPDEEQNGMLAVVYVDEFDKYVGDLAKAEAAKEAAYQANRPVQFKPRT